MHPGFLSTSLTDIALKCWSLASKLRLPAQKTCTHQFNNDFKDSRFDFVFQGFVFYNLLLFHFQGSISCDSFSDSTMHCLPVSDELLGTLL